VKCENNFCFPMQQLSPAVLSTGNCATAKLATANWQLPTGNCQLPTGNCKLR